MSHLKFCFLVYTSVSLLSSDFTWTGVHPSSRLSEALASCHCSFRQRRYEGLQRRRQNAHSSNFLYQSQRSKVCSTQARNISSLFCRFFQQTWQQWVIFEACPGFHDSQFWKILGFSCRILLQLSWSVTTWYALRKVFHAVQQLCIFPIAVHWE